jgi:hypothetical protein
VGIKWRWTTRGDFDTEVEDEDCIKQKPQMWGNEEKE